VDGNKPLVGIPDTGGTSAMSNAAARASGQVAASTLVSAPIFSSAYAAARTKTIDVLPVGSSASPLVRATLTSSSLTCVSGALTAAAYDLTVDYPGDSKHIQWSTTAPATELLPDPSTVSFTVGAVTHTLSEYLSWSVAGAVSEGNNGVSNFGPVLRLTINKAVIGTTTDVTLELGVLSCVADDRR
jgi:hypothetical protein